MIKKIRSAVKAWLFRMRHGFDYRDCWNLDHAMAKWLYPRLFYLAKISNGSPFGYPTPLGLGNDTKLEDVNTDHDAWVNDMRYAAAALKAMVDYQDSDSWDIDTERQIDEDANRAMRWIARYWMALWD